MTIRKINRRDFGLFVTGGAALSIGLLAAPRIVRAQSEKVVIATTAGSQARTLSQFIVHKGYLAEQGLTPEFVPVSDGSKALAAVMSGDVDICMGSGFPNILPALERGGKLKIIAKAQNYVNAGIYTGRDDINSVADFRGKQIGSGSIGAQSHIYMSALITKAGIDVSDVQFVNVGGSSAIFKAVAAGVIDAGPGEPELIFDVEKFKVKSLGFVWDLVPEIVGQASYTSDRTIARKRDVVVRTLAGYRRMYEYLNGGDSLQDWIEARTTALQGDQTVQATNQWKLLQQSQMMPADLVLPPDRIEWMQELNLSLGIQQTKIPYKQITDPTIAEDAIKLEAAT